MSHTHVPVTTRQDVTPQGTENEVLPMFLDYYERFPGYGLWAAVEKSTERFCRLVPFSTSRRRPARRTRAQLPAAQIGLGKGCVRWWACRRMGQGGRRRKWRRRELNPRKMPPPELWLEESRNASARSLAGVGRTPSGAVTARRRAPVGEPGRRTFCPAHRGGWDRKDAPRHGIEQTRAQVGLRRSLGRLLGGGARSSLLGVRRGGGESPRQEGPGGHARRSRPDRCGARPTLSAVRGRPADGARGRPCAGKAAPLRGGCNAPRALGPRSRLAPRPRRRPLGRRLDA